MLGVEGLRFVPLQPAEAGLDDAEALVLDMGEDLARKSPLHGVGFDDEQRALDGHLDLPLEG